MGSDSKRKLKNATNNPGFALANPGLVRVWQAGDSGSQEHIERWSFGRIDIDKGKDHEDRLREQAHNLIGQDDAPLLEDDRRRHAIARRLQREQQASSTMLTSGGGNLG